MTNNNKEQQPSASSEADPARPQEEALLLDGPSGDAPPADPNASTMPKLLTFYEGQFSDLPTDPPKRLNQLESMLKRTMRVEVEGNIASVAEGLIWEDIRSKELHALRMIDDGGAPDYCKRDEDGTNIAEHEDDLRHETPSRES